MLKDNELIVLKGGDVIEALCDMEYILISLREIARYYYQRHVSPPNESTPVAYALETTRFIEKNNINERLIRILRILSEPFNDALGEDEMDDIERSVDKIKYWRKPGD